MSLFENILGKQILSIQRLDSKVDYEFYSPYAIIITIDGHKEKLIISATNDGSSVDIKMTTDKQIESDYGLEFCEHTLNDLRNDDELKEFEKNIIQQIRIAEFKLPEIQGRGIVIHQGKYAGIELKTDSHKLLLRTTMAAGAILTIN